VLATKFAFIIKDMQSSFYRTRVHLSDKWVRLVISHRLMTKDL